VGPNEENFRSWKAGSSVACLKREIASERCASLRSGRSLTEISAELALGTTLGGMTDPISSELHASSQDKTNALVREG